MIRMYRCLRYLVAGLVLLGPFLADAGHAEIRKPSAAGGFYPADSLELSFKIEDYLKRADEDAIDGDIIALFVPHAGLAYSGRIASHAYTLLEDVDVNRFIICGPSHKYAFDGVSVYGPDISWKTPFGLVPSDSRLCEDLLDRSPLFVVDKKAHAEEHSIEVQLPFLQIVSEDPFIVPLSFGRLSGENIDEVAAAIADVSRDNDAILIASTDWQHYRSADSGRVLDSVGMECLRSLDPDRLADALRSGRTEMCGGSAAVAVMKAALKLGANRIKILAHGDSGDVTGSDSAVVGYVAAVMYRARQDSDEPETAADAATESSDSKHDLTPEDKRELLKIARESIESYLINGDTKVYDMKGKLAEPGAAFVTIRQHGKLRGCIGRTTAVDPLYKTVSGCALQAAVADLRFTPLSLKEYAHGITIQIDVLTPPEDVKSMDDIRIGRDGLIVKLNGKEGVLLPQVAVEQNWNPEEFLRRTCIKAGLQPEDYKDKDAVVQKFRAVIFSDDQ